MAIATEAQGRDFPAGPASAANRGGDRETAFAKARRHSMMVRALRKLLPAVALTTLASYGLFMQHSIKIGEGTLTVGPVALSTDVLTMHNPRYEGFNDDGGRFQVSARTAEQTSTARDAPIKLNDIEGSIAQPNKTVTKLVSPRGLFDSKANQLELFESINITSSDGMAARLTSAKVFMKEGRITSGEPVTVDMPTGSLRGNSMVLLQKTRELIFSDGVSARFRPPERKPKPDSEAQRSPAESFMGNSNAPVDVTAPTLKINDASKIATFSDNVRAEQDGSVLTSRQLEIAYDGASPSAATGQASATGRLKRLIARDDVILVRGNDRATARMAEFDPVNETAALTGGVGFTSGADRNAVGDRADLDFKANTALLTGPEVIVTQGKNNLRGRRLHVDRQNGTMQLSAPADQWLPQGRISARFHQPETRSRKAEPKSGEESVGLRFQTDPNAPIDIEADLLDVDDKAHTATFRGDVVAVQGDFTIRTVEMVATYSGQAGVNLMQQPEAGARTSAQLQRVQARKKVVVTSKNDQSATGDWADFDVKANTVTLGGDVVVNQGRNVVRGPRLVIDMVTGVSRMETGRQPGTANGSNTPSASAQGIGDAKNTNGETVKACGGRMCAVFYPKDAKAALKRGLGVAKEKAGAAEKSGATEPGASSWNSTTTTPGRTQ